MEFRVYRDCDQRFRLRKVVIELSTQEGLLLDRTRMFAGLFFEWRLMRRCQCMIKRGGVMLLAADMPTG